MDREDSVAGVEDPGSKSESVAGVGDLGRKGGGEAERPQPGPTADAPASLDLNALDKMSPEEIAELATKCGVFLHAARTRHYHILDLVRAALGAGSTVTAAGFVGQACEAFAC